MKGNNERGAGRKPLPYETRLKRVPVDLIEKINALIREYKKEQGLAPKCKCRRVN